MEIIKRIVTGFVDFVETMLVGLGLIAVILVAMYYYVPII